MASREGDIAQWLQNKLGATDELWSANSICSLLNREKLLNIQDCFHNIIPLVKVKLMMSFLHLPKRNIEEWRKELVEILQFAADDPDQWVAMVGGILRTYPETGSLNLEIDDHHSFFHQVQADLKKEVRKSAEKNVTMQPMECLYLSQKANISVAGHQAPQVKNFTLKRKPKSASLRAELLQKSSEAANNQKKGGNSMPFKYRSFAKKMDEETALPPKGLRGAGSAGASGFLKANPPKRSSMNSYTNRNTSSTTAARREGGVKMIEIEALPLGRQEAKRRRKIEQQEAIKEKEAQKEAAAAAALSTATPDYAAGLSASLNVGGVTAAAGSGPSYIPTARLPTATAPGHATLPAGSLSVATQQARDNLQSQLQQLNSTQQSAGTTIGLDGGTAHIIIQNSNKTAATAAFSSTPTTTGATFMTQQLAGTSTVGAAGAGGNGNPAIIRLPPGAKLVTSSQGGKTQGQIIVTQAKAQQLLQLQPQQLQQLQQQQQQKKVTLGPQQNQLVQQQPQQLIVQQQQPQQQQQRPQLLQQQQKSQQPQLAQVVPQLQQQQQQQRPAQQQSQLQQQLGGMPVGGKKGLMLTREQMMEAQDMFRSSNKVTRPEKALILGFMAGSRENPCPQQGDVVNIRLSENQESVAQPDGLYAPMVVDVYFQMNYITGEWKKITKYRIPDAD